MLPIDVSEPTIYGISVVVSSYIDTNEFTSISGEAKEASIINNSSYSSS